MILLNRIDPLENLNRWYRPNAWAFGVSIQPTLFHPCAVGIAWGRRDNTFQQWRAIPVDTPDQAQELADRIVRKKMKRGYLIYSTYYRPKPHAKTEINPPPK